MTIPFLALDAAYRELQPEIDAAIARALASGDYIGGPEVEAFEQEFAAYTQARYCTGVGNGLDALYLALRALDLGPDDEVIVPSHTYIATWLAVSRCGAIPVPVEPSDTTYNLDPQQIEAAITARTRVILPVHLYGHPADLEPILAIARRHGLRVLDDAAQAHGACYKGQRIGALCDATAWSFYPAKNLGAFGDGGAVTTNAPDIADRIRVLRNYGSRVKYQHEVQGLNSRLDPLQAAALRVKLRYLDEWNRRRTGLARHYLDALATTDLILPPVQDWAEPVWHLFVVRHPRRDALRQCLTAAGIATLIHYPIPPHRQAAYAGAAVRSGVFPLAEQLANEVLSLPLGPQLPVAAAGRISAALDSALASLPIP